MVKDNHMYIYIYISQVDLSLSDGISHCILTFSTGNLGAPGTNWRGGCLHQHQVPLRHAGFVRWIFQPAQ